MNIDEVIEKLIEIRKEHGSITVYQASDDEMNEVNPVWSIGVFYQDSNDPENIYNNRAEAESDEVEDPTPIVVI